MTFPVLVMSFNHYPIISPMVVRQKQRYGLALAEGKCAQIQRYGILLCDGGGAIFCSQLRVKPVAAATGGSQSPESVDFVLSCQSVRYTDYCLAIADYRLCRYY